MVCASSAPHANRNSLHSFTGCILHTTSSWLQPSCAQPLSVINKPRHQHLPVSLNHCKSEGIRIIWRLDRSFALDFYSPSSLLHKREEHPFFPEKRGRIRRRFEEPIECYSIYLPPLEVCVSNLRIKERRQRDHKWSQLGASERFWRRTSEADQHRPDRKVLPLR